MGSPVAADLMVIRKDGTHRTSGWTFHDHRDAKTPKAKNTPASAKTPRTDILSAITATSDRHQYNRALVAAGLSTQDWRFLFQAMIEAESGYNPSALSPKGAYGLGQLMPETARSLGVDRRNMPQNLDGAARYLLAQLSAFKTTDLALAAYNAGPYRVLEYRGIPPFSETRAYIARVNQIRTRLSGSPNVPGPALDISPQVFTAHKKPEVASRRPALVLQLH